MPKQIIADWELNEAIELALETGFDVHEQECEFEERIQEMFMEDPLATAQMLVRNLIPMAFMARSELSGKTMQGFGKVSADGHIMAVVIQEF